jgi:hypothetical protein
MHAVADLEVDQPHSQLGSSSIDPTHDAKTS